MEATGGEEAHLYDEAYYDFNGQLGDRPALRLYARLAKRYLKPTAILDVGCGTGHLLAHLDRIAPSDGLEISAYSAAESRRVSPRSTVFEGGDQLPDTKYDAFTSVHVFEHIPDDSIVELLADLRRATTSDARALIVMPDPAGTAARLHGAAWNALRDPTHINMKTHAEWRAFFEANGLRVLREGTDGLWNFPYSKLPKLLDALRYGLPMAAQFILGRMILRPGRGESSFFVLTWS